MSLRRHVPGCDRDLPERFKFGDLPTLAELSAIVESAGQAEYQLVQCVALHQYRGAELLDSGHRLAGSLRRAHRAAAPSSAAVSASRSASADSARSVTSWAWSWMSVTTTCAT